MKARLSWSLDVDCPHCNESVDVSKTEQEHECTMAIFNNQWKELEGYEAECPKCGKFFTIEGVEY